ncbi:MAG TPA: hypothetical protein VFZ78_00090 [Flavisolibacter sp.]
MQNGSRQLTWKRICLLNLSIVALLGLILRSKMIFPLPSLDYKNFLNAHSHYAFAGWAGLALITLMIYGLLPAMVSSKRIYRWILAGTQVSAVGMLVSFPIQGYAGWSIFFSTLYIVVTYVFAWVFIRDLLSAPVTRTVRLLAIGAVASLVVSSIGPFGLAYILITKSAKSVLYRDCIYTYLHFQYNGFFTLSVFALVFQSFRSLLVNHEKAAWRFGLFTVLSLVPSLFLSLLWHETSWFYWVGGLGCVLMMIGLYYFLALVRPVPFRQHFNSRLAMILFIFSMLSFILKTVLNLGTLLPQLGHLVFADRPLIIGFLHLVFLGFITFYILAVFSEEGIFGYRRRNWVLVFTTGIIANQVFLMIQGLEILFKSNSELYNRLLWVAAIFLFAGAVMMAVAAWAKKKGHEAWPLQ